MIVVAATLVVQAYCFELELTWSMSRRISPNSYPGTKVSFSPSLAGSCPSPSGRGVAAWWVFRRRTRRPRMKCAVSWIGIGSGLAMRKLDGWFRAERSPGVSTVGPGEAQRPPSALMII